jgi:hypothetical protein
MFGTVRNGFCELFVCFANGHPPGPGSATSVLFSHWSTRMGDHAGDREEHPRQLPKKRNAVRVWRAVQHAFPRPGPTPQ